MPTEKSYFAVMIESLQKKSQVLDDILKYNEKQAKLFRDDEFSEEEFDRLADEKAELIKRVSFLDDGFQAVYERIRSEVLEHKDRYQEEIRALQELIRQVTEKSAQIQAGEERNRQAFAGYCTTKRKSVRAARTSVTAANKYYRSMSQVNAVDPQLMDKRK